jgi:hypothetical protein
MYLGERLRSLPAGQFLEIGPGSGEITSLLLGQGWTGKAFDRDAETINRLSVRFADEIAEGRLTLVHDNYLLASIDIRVNLVISCMVMEHLEDDEQLAFLARSAAALHLGGRMIGLVPASPRHWGIEDDIAGHCRRYTRGGLTALLAASGWQMVHVAGLTFPVSNLLLPLSNFLVRKQERAKLMLSQSQRTTESGRRQVRFKTHFPTVLALVLNELCLAPWHLLQKLCMDSERALVLYFEAKPDGERTCFEETENRSNLSIHTVEENA